MLGKPATQTHDDALVHGAPGKVTWQSRTRDVRERELGAVGLGNGLQQALLKLQERLHARADRILGSKHPCVLQHHVLRETIEATSGKLSFKNTSTLFLFGFVRRMHPCMPRRKVLRCPMVPVWGNSPNFACLFCLAHAYERQAAPPGALVPLQRQGHKLGAQACFRPSTRSPGYWQARAGHQGPGKPWRGGAPGAGARTCLSPDQPSTRSAGLGAPACRVHVQKNPKGRGARRRRKPA